MNKNFYINIFAEGSCNIKYILFWDCTIVHLLLLLLLLLLTPLDFHIKSSFARKFMMMIGVCVWYVVLFGKCAILLPPKYGMERFVCVWQKNEVYLKWVSYIYFGTNKLCYIKFSRRFVLKLFLHSTILKFCI